MICCQVIWQFGRLEVAESAAAAEPPLQQSSCSPGLPSPPLQPWQGQLLHHLNLVHLVHLLWVANLQGKFSNISHGVHPPVAATEVGAFSVDTIPTWSKPSQTFLVTWHLQKINLIVIPNNFHLPIHSLLMPKNLCADFSETNRVNSGAWEQDVLMPLL